MCKNTETNGSWRTTPRTQRLEGGGFPPQGLWLPVSPEILFGPEGPLGRPSLGEQTQLIRRWLLCCGTRTQFSFPSKAGHMDCPSQS